MGGKGVNVRSSSSLKVDFDFSYGAVQYFASSGFACALSFSMFLISNRAFLYAECWFSQERVIAWGILLRIKKLGGGKGSRYLLDGH